MVSHDGRPNRYTAEEYVPRRLLLYSGSYNHITDGVTLTLNRLVAYLESLGTEVLVIAPTTEHPELEHAGSLLPVPSLPVPGRGEYRVATFVPPRVRAKIAKFKPDIVHVATPDLLGRWVMSYARRKGIPVVSTYHTDFLSYLRYYDMEFLENFLLGYLRYFYRRCDLVCVPSQSMIDELESRGMEGSMRIWARGVEKGRFSPEFRSSEWRSQIGATDSTPVIAYVGRLVWEKNVRHLVDVSRRLTELRIDHIMVVVGDGPAREELKELLPEAVFTGHLNGEQLSTAYASSDIFFFPSTTETFGNVVLEAMASGLPCVCAEATGSSDLVLHGTTGYLAPGDAPEELADHVARLASDTDLRSELGRQSHARSQQFRWENILRTMVDHYNEAEVIAAETPWYRRALGMAPTHTH